MYLKILFVPAYGSSLYKETQCLQQMKNGTFEETNDLDTKDKQDTSNYPLLNYPN